MTIGGDLKRLTRVLLLRRPSVPAGLSLPPADCATGLRVTFLGNATLLFDDGETQILTDGFFSRPRVLCTLITPVNSDPQIVASCLERAGVTKLAAVFALHSHYDHLLDAPAVALRTDAMLLGSSSTVMVGRSSGVSENRLTVVSEGQGYPFGRFTLTPIVSAHVPPPRLVGTIETPLKLPARVSSYRMATCYSLLVQHDGHRILILGSAGAVPGAFDKYDADVVYLAVGALGRQTRDYQDQYWNNVVAAVGARRIVPIHWDDFSKPLSEKLVPLPFLVDDLEATMHFLCDRAVKAHVDVRIPQAWIAVDPFVLLDGNQGKIAESTR